MYINTLNLVIFVSYIVQYVSANLGIFGYEKFANYSWVRSPEENKNDCVSWSIQNNDKYETDKFVRVTIKPGCTEGLKLTYSGETKFFSAFQYYSELEVDLFVSEGQLDIKLESSTSDDSAVIKSLKFSEFTELPNTNNGFEHFEIKFPEYERIEDEKDFDVINFSNPDPNNPVTFNMRQARLIYITQRAVLDDLKLYGNDWSYDVINSTLVNNVMYKFLSSRGCISIDLKDPYIGPWASVRFDIKAPKDFILGIEMEIEGIHSLTVADVPTKLKKEGITLDEENWNTLELRFNKIIYDKLYDRLDICNQGPSLNWLKIRNIYFEPKFKFIENGKETKTCCAYNQCICTVKHKKLYVRKSGAVSSIIISKYSYIISIALTSVLLLFI